MKAIIFAAGNGIRMRPLTLERPKSLLKVLDKPILHYTFEALPDDIDEAVLVTGYKGDMIKEFLGNEFKGRCVTYIDQAEPMGTAHALLSAKSAIEGEDRFLAMNGDDLYKKEDIEKLFKHERALLTYKVEDPGRFGIINTDKAGKVLDVHERPTHPTSNLANIGVYLLDHSIFDYYPNKAVKGEFYITDGLAGLVKHKDVFAEKADFWIPLGYPADIQKAEEALRNASEEHISK